MPRPDPDTGRIGAALRFSTGALLDLYRRGRSSAVELIFAREAPSLRRWARGRLPRWARSFVDTDDLVQTALLRTLPHLERFEPRRKRALAAYLQRAVKSQIQDELRRIQRTPYMESASDEREISVASAAPSPLDELLEDEAGRQFARALSELKDRDRTAVMARLRLHYSYDQIALVLGLRSADSARMVVTRALERLINSLNATSTSNRA